MFHTNKYIFSFNKFKLKNKTINFFIKQVDWENALNQSGSVRFIGFDESSTIWKDNYNLACVEDTLKGDIVFQKHLLSSIIQIHNDYDGFVESLKNRFAPAYFENCEGVYDINQECTLRIIDETREWYFHNDIDIVTISYSEGISLFHHYFSAYKILVEQYLPPEQKQKITNTDWWPKFLSELPKLEKIYNELVEKGEIEVQELSPENTEKNVETKNFQ